MASGEKRDEQLLLKIAEELRLILSTAEDRRLSEMRVVDIHARAGGRNYTVVLAPGESESDPGALKELLVRASGYVRYELGTALNLKRTPEITLMLDPRSVGGSSTNR